MIITWIVITLLIAVVAGLITAAAMNDSFGFFLGFGFTANLSFWIGVIYVAAHFVGKFW